MKYMLIAALFMAFATEAKCQSSPKVYDPCQKLDTNTIRELIIGTWVDQSDTSHILIITDDTLTEKIVIMEGGVAKRNISYFSYKFTDNMFSSDAVTCYSIVEYMEDNSTHTDFAINSITHNYMLLGGTGEKVFKKRD